MSKIGIIGGGMMGLTLAQKLCGQGHDVSLFEKDKQLGGLATYHDYSKFFWDRFYHVILPCDKHLTNYLAEVGLGESIVWHNALTGFYVDREFYSLSNSLEFLRFPPLNLIQKVRLALTILCCARIKNWRRLEKIKVEDWLVKTCGRKTFEKLWKPLLLAKLGESYNRVSAVFIWTYMKRTFEAKETSSQKEQLGHVKGGYKTVLKRLETLILESGSRIHTDITVDRIEPNGRRGVTISTNRGDECFDKVVFTSPVNVLHKVASTDLVQIKENGNSVEYLGVVCMVLISREPLVPFYVVNIADERIPFTGVIGMSSVVDTEETAGFHITYLPKYTLSNDPWLQQPDDVIREEFLGGLRLMFPDFELKNIDSVHINRAFKVQPLPVLNYSDLIPQVQTKHKDFFVLNTSQFVNDTLNNNSVIRHVNEFLAKCGHLLGTAGYKQKVETPSFLTNSDKQQ